MITVQQLRRAKGIEGYYASALSEGASECYASQRGVWYGKGAERIQLPPEVTKEDLIAVCNNEVPKTKERLTARTNDIRHVPVIDSETGEVKMREVSNRRIAVDFTFSVPKSVSMHLALTHDVEAEKLVHEACGRPWMIWKRRSRHGYAPTVLIMIGRPATQLSRALSTELRAR